MSRILAVAVLGFFCSACSVTRKIPEGQYLLQKVTIESDKSTPRKERITAADLEKYVRQTPNKRFLGTNFYVWLYEQANPGKQNWWNNWKRKIGQEPVLLDMSLTERSAQNLKVYMDTRGFFSSQATFEVDTTSRRRRAKVVYRTRQGEPYRIDSISYDFQDKFLEQIILPDTANTLIRPGRVFDIAVLDRERERVTAFLKERGYYNFTVNNIDYVADTLGGNHQVDVQVNIKQYLTGYNERGQAVMDNNMVYRIDRINVFPAYDPTVARTDSTFLSRLDTLYYRGLNIIYEKRPNLRPAILRQSVPLYPNYVYNSAQVNRAYTDLMSLGYFKSAKIAFVEQPRSVDVTNYVSFIGASADSTQTRFTKEGYLECNILCTPALKQSFKVDLEGSTTSSFYGLKATVGYQNRNIFRGAEAYGRGRRRVPAFRYPCASGRRREDRPVVYFGRERPPEHAGRSRRSGFRRGALGRKRSMGRGARTHPRRGRQTGGPGQILYGAVPCRAGTRSGQRRERGLSRERRNRRADSARPRRQPVA